MFSLWDALAVRYFHLLSFWCVCCCLAMSEASSRAGKSLGDRTAKGSPAFHGPEMAVNL